MSSNRESIITAVLEGRAPADQLTNKEVLKLQKRVMKAIMVKKSKTSLMVFVLSDNGLRH